MANDFGHRFVSDAVLASSMGAGQQAGALMNMIGRTQEAIRAENESRVAQERERRRMEHEKQMLRMQMEAQERQAQILQRLQAQRQGLGSSDQPLEGSGFATDHYGKVIARWGN